MYACTYYVVQVNETFHKLERVYTIGQNDHSNPYLESTTVLSDITDASRAIKILSLATYNSQWPTNFHVGLTLILTEPSKYAVIHAVHVH